MPNTVITQAGLDFVLSADNNGPKIAPMYFLPVYDYRIDSLIHSDALAVSAVSQVASETVSRTSPFGEIIWNTDGQDYDLTEISQNFIISGADSVWVDPNLTSPVQSQKSQVNTYDGVPLTNHIVGTSATYNQASNLWEISDGEISAGNNAASLSGRSKYFQVVDYYPVTSGDGAGVRGNVKCILRKDIGEVKYNKVALYVVRFNADGTETGEDPVFFSETYMNTTVVKTSFGSGGFDEHIIDAQIDIASISSDISNIFYSTSGDYVSRVPEGIYYPEALGLGSFDESTNTPQATIHARHSRTFPNKPNARFDYSDSIYISEDVTSAGDVETDHVHGSASWKTIKDIDTYEEYPEDDGILILGKESNRYRSMFLSDKIMISAVNAEDSFISISACSAADSGGIKSRVELSNRSAIEFEKGPTNEKYGNIKGADIWRDEEDLALYTRASTSAYNDSIHIMICPGYINSEDEFDGHDIKYRFVYSWSTLHEHVNQNSRTYIVGWNAIKTWGPIELNHTYEQNGNTAIYTRNKTITLCPHLKTGKTQQDILSVTSDIDYRLVAETTNDVIGIGRSSGVVNVVGSINALHTISPIIPADNSNPVNSSFFCSLGVGQTTQNGLTSTTRKRWRKLFVQQIGAYQGEYEPAVASIDTSGGGATYIDERVDAIYVKNIGNDDLGVVDNIYATNAKIASLETTNAIKANGGINFGTLDQGNSTISTFKEDTIPIDFLNGSYFVIGTGSINVTRINNIVFLSFGYCQFEDTAETDQLLIRPRGGTGWKTWMIPKSSRTVCCTGTNNNFAVSCAISIVGGLSSNWNTLIWSAWSVLKLIVGSSATTGGHPFFNGTWFSDDGNDGSFKYGLQANTVSYHID